jgi:hypothetical protein
MCASAQEFTLFDRKVQVHGFASQGFAFSDENNFLTMKTSAGSFAMTDAGLNMSTNVTDRFRVGGQVYIRNVGELGNWQPKLDWAYADYRFVDWLGVRAGRVKTPLGLYNDVQDIDSMLTFALLPQSIYPMDLRGNFISHNGVDIYGLVPLPGKSKLRYTVYAGVRTNDPEGGYYFSATSAGNLIANMGGNAAGADLRWETPVRGFIVGVSQMAQTAHVRGTAFQMHGAPFRAVTNTPEEITQPYVEYIKGRWHLTGEFRRDQEVLGLTSMGVPAGVLDGSNKGWYAAAAFRVNKHLELGTYHSRFYVDRPSIPVDAADHIYDQAVTARFDFAKYFYAKLEGHFMDGYGDVYSARGFYSAVNPSGLKPKTNLLVVRTGISF